VPRRIRRDAHPAQRRRATPAANREGRSGAPNGAGPAWAALEGFEVWPAVGPKRYRCPWCEGWIEPGISHVVAFESGRPEERRHYHSPCWRRYAARARPTPPPD
jgi:hypothetical protein